MPKPPAAFSPLTTTRSRPRSRRKAGRRSITTSRPERPTRSPQNRIRISFTLLNTLPGPGLGHDPIQPLVEWPARQIVGFLSREGYADRQHRMSRMRLVPALFQGPVIEAAAIAEAKSVPIERQQ